MEAGGSPAAPAVPAGGGRVESATPPDSTMSLAELKTTAGALDTTKFVCKPQCETALLTFDRLCQHDPTVTPPPSHNPKP